MKKSATGGVRMAKLLTANREGVSRTLKAQAHDVGILQLHYDKIETTRKLRPIEKEESE